MSIISRLSKNKINKSYIFNHLPGMIVKIVKYVFLVDVAFVFLFPFLYMVITSIKSPADLANSTIKWIPESVYWNNFLVANVGLRFIQSLPVSIIITLLATVGHLISCSFAGYGFARYKARIFSLFFSFVILSILVPVPILVLPEYIVYSRLGWINTILPIILPAFFGFGLRGGLFVYIFRQFYTGLPKELEEAARVDGCGPLRLFFRIIIPLSKSPILVCTILSIVWQWNESYETSIFLSNEVMTTVIARLPVLYNVLSTNASAQEVLMQKLIYNEAVVMAATLLTLLPVLLIYFILQKKFMEGVERSGIVG